MSMRQTHDRMSATEMSRWMEERAATEAPPDPALLQDDPEPAELEGYLAAQMPDARLVSVWGLEKIAYGVAREHYSFDAGWVRGDRKVRQSFVLLRDHEISDDLAARRAGLEEPDPTLLWVAGVGDRERELRILRFLEKTCVPAPRARWLDTNGEWLGRPFTIHERIPGRIAPSFTLLGMQGAAQRGAIARQFVELLAAIHAADWRGSGLGSLGVPERGSRAYAAAALKCLEQRLALYGAEFAPVVQRALAWLHTRTPGLEAVALCHGDYKTDNLIFEGDRIRAIIDWEFAHLGDPCEDLGAVCMGLHVSDERCMGLLTRDELLEGYARAAGRAADPARVLFWEVFCTVRMISFAHAMTEMLERPARLASQPETLERIDATRAFIASMIHRMRDDLESRMGADPP
jgi:aminoglycoside phosphotransferase (APT) family kinase protein